MFYMFKNTTKEVKNDIVALQKKEFLKNEDLTLITTFKDLYRLLKELKSQFKTFHCFKDPFKTLEDSLRGNSLIDTCQ